ncbi:MAG: DUF349 domain-containing protein [Chlorobi bacterium]|nr:DUF349 domain-containing protein [Chlorobiota bacterium]
MSEQTKGPQNPGDEKNTHQSHQDNLNSRNEQPARDDSPEEHPENAESPQPADTPTPEEEPAGEESVIEAGAQAESQSSAQPEETGDTRDRRFDNLTAKEQQLLESDDIEHEKTGDEVIAEIQQELSELAEKEDEAEKELAFDLSRIRKFNLRELVDEFREILDTHPVERVKKYLQDIKNIFDEKFYDLKEKERQKFIETHGDDKAFYFHSPEKEEMDVLYREYRRRVKEAARRFKELLEENKRKKKEIVEEIKSLIMGTSDDSKHIIQRFRELKNKWYEIQPVPKNESGILYQNFKYWVEQFYESLKFREDYLKKLYEENLAEKQKLIQRAKELLEWEDPVKAFRELQVLHRLWKERTGPVAPEHKEEVWQEFKSVTQQLHEKRRRYLQQLKEEYQQNLEKKRELIQKMDEILAREPQTHREWQELIKEVDALREEFQNIGFVPQRYKDEIRKEFYDKVREFNRKKNKFYKELKAKQRQNLELKRQILAEAKALLEAEDVPDAEEKCKDIRERWYAVGHVPRNVSEELKAEFREVCNEIMKKYHTQLKSERDEEYHNYLRKKEYLKELKTALREDQLGEVTLEKVKEILDNWREMGRVPENVRYINSKFHKFISSLIYKYNLDENELRLMQFKGLVDEMAASGDTRKLKRELKFVTNRIAEIEDEIRQSEANLRLFKVSEDNKDFLEQLHQKIEDKKKQLEQWKQKREYLLSVME